MDGEQCLHANESWVKGEHRAEVDGDQSGLPVVTMQDPWAEHAARYSQRRLREHPKAHRVIGVVAGGVAVVAVAVVKRRDFQKVKRYTAGDDLIEAGFMHAAPKPDRQVVIDAPRRSQVDSPVA